MGKTHWVTCVVCGKRFDASNGGYYNQSTKRYTCKKCGKAVIRSEKRYSAANKAADNAGNNTGKEWFKKYWKPLVGGLLIFGGYGNCGTDNDAAVFGVFAGLALLAWYFVPKYLEKKKAEEAAEQIRKDEEEERARMEREIDERRWICERCGANTKGKVCEYCDSPYEQ